jgi:hypothetical protein
MANISVMRVFKPCLPCGANGAGAKLLPQSRGLRNGMLAIGGRCRGGVAFLATEGHAPVNKPRHPSSPRRNRAITGLTRAIAMAALARVGVAVTKMRVRKIEIGQG